MNMLHVVQEFDSCARPGGVSKNLEKSLPTTFRNKLLQV